MSYIIKGKPATEDPKKISDADEISGTAPDRESADKVFEQMTNVILSQLKVPKRSSAIVAMYSTKDRPNKHIRKVRVRHNDEGKSIIEGCK